MIVVNQNLTEHNLYHIVKLRTGEKVLSFTGTNKDFNRILSKDYVSFHRMNDFAFERKEISKDGFTSVKVYGSLFIKKKDFMKSSKQPVDFYEVLVLNLGG